MISTDTTANVIQDALPPHDQIGWAASFRGPRAVALAWLSVYLGVTGVVFASGGHGWLAIVHLAVIAVATWAINCHPEERSAWLRMTTALRTTIGDLLPLIAAPLLYAEIPALIAALGTSYHDGMVQRWELTLFGSQPAQSLAGHLPFVVLSELLHAGYLAYYLVIFAPPLLLFVRRERRGFSETVLALTITCTLCWTIFMLLPVQGPRYLWSAPPGIPDGPVRRLAVRILAAGSSRGAAFPSSHMAVSAAQVVMAWRWQRPVSWMLLVVAILIGCGAVYGGFHYGVDMIAGAVLGVLVSSSVFVLATNRGGRRA